MADVVLESIHGDPKEITRTILLAKEHMARRAKMHRRFEQVSKTEAFTSALGKDVNLIMTELSNAEKWLVDSGEAIVKLLRVLAEELHPHVGKEELSIEAKRAHIREITAKIPPILEAGGIADEVTTKIHGELEDVHSRLITAFTSANPKHKDATEKGLSEMKELDKQYELDLAALSMSLLMSPEATASAPPAISLLLLPGCENLGANLFAHGFVPHVRPETGVGQAAKRLGETAHKKTLLEVRIAKVDQEVDDQSAKYLSISEAVLSLYAQVIGHERFIRHLAAHLMVLEMEEEAPGDDLLAEHAKEVEERIAQNNAFIELFSNYVNDLKQGMVA